MPSRTQTNISASAIGVRRAVGQSIGAVAGVGPLGVMGGLASPLLTDLVAYWNLDETSGDRSDSSGNGNTLTDNNTVGSAAGVGGGQTAADFIAANNEYLSNAGSDGLRGSTGTFSRFFWVRPDALGTSVILSNILTGSSEGYDCLLISNILQFRVYGSSLLSINAAGALSVGSWASVYIELDGSAARIRVNDTSETTGVLSGSYAPGTTAGFRLGISLVDTAPFDGRIQATGAWSRTLTAGEITWLHNGGTAARLYSDVAAYTG